MNDWQRNMACTLDDAWLFDIDSKRDRQKIHAAVKVCLHCPVVFQCALNAPNVVSIDNPAQVIAATLYIKGKPSRLPPPPLPKRKPAPWSSAELRAAHAAHYRGERSPEVVAGEREYQRLRGLARRVKAAS